MLDTREGAEGEMVSPGIGEERMAYRLVTVVPHANAVKCVKITKCADLGEYRCRLYIHGEAFPDADYFTDDRRDAIETARHMVETCKAGA